jgi:Arc/MetJ-type ribon-helix-helix transcriptional regulator
MTITVRLPNQLEEELRVRLEAQGLELSEFVREAIAEKLERDASGPSSAYETGKDLFGRHGSGRGDLSTNRKALLDELLRAKHHR